MLHYYYMLALTDVHSASYVQFMAWVQFRGNTHNDKIQTLKTESSF